MAERERERERKRGRVSGWLDVGASYIIERADVVFGVDFVEKWKVSQRG
jgi:hypothetical protein